MSKLQNRIINERRDRLTDSEVDYVLATRGRPVATYENEPPLTDFQKEALAKIRAEEKRQNPNYERDCDRVMAEYCLGLH